MPITSIARLVNPFRAAATACAALCILLPALAQAATAQTVGQKEIETRGGIVGVQVEKDAELAVPLCPGGNVHYTVRIENIGTLAGTGEIFDPIPEGMTVLVESISGGASYDAANDQVVWEGFLAPGGDHTIGFSVTVDPGVPNGTIVNRATGRMIAGETVVETHVDVPVEVACPPITVDVSKDRHLALPLCPGATIRYAIRITNTSTRNGLLEARIEDPVPANAEFAGGLTPDTKLENGTVVWEGKLGPGQSHEIGFSVRVPDAAPDGTPINNRATARLEDPMVGDFAEHVDEVVDVVDCPEDDLDLELEKSSSFEGPLCPGSRIRYEVRLTNTSEVEGLLDAEITDPLPANTTFAGDLSPPEAAFADGQVTWKGELAQGQSRTVAFDVTVAPGVPDGTRLVNSATARLREPASGLEVTGEDGTEEAVKCVEDVKEAAPTANLQLWLKYVEFEDNMDDEFPIFGRGEGDGYGFAVLEIDNPPPLDEPRRVTTIGGRDEWVLEDLTEQQLGASGKSLLGDDEEARLQICCTLEDVELAIDLWENDDSSELYDKLSEAVDEILEQLEKPELQAYKAILDGVVELMEHFELHPLDDPPDELGNWNHRDLKTPWAVNPARFDCPLDEAVLDGDKEELTEFHHQGQEFVDRTEEGVEFVFELRSGGTDNGRFWLEWDTEPRTETCNELRDGALGGKGAGAAGGLDLASISTVQVSQRELDLAWTFEPLGGLPLLADVVREHGSVSFYAILTTPRNADMAPPASQVRAWRLGVDLRLDSGQVHASSSVALWDGEDWLETGAEALETQVGERIVAATFDHRDVGELDVYSVAGELLEAGAVIDAVPDTPQNEFLLRWGEDRTPPFVTSVRLVPLEVSEGPDGELLPAGSVERIRVGLSERVDLIPGDVRLEPSIDVDVTLEGRTLTIEPRELLGAGTYELVLREGILDGASNRLDGDGDGAAGGDFVHAFDIRGTRFFSSDRDGQPKSRFVAGEEIFAAGFGFDPGTHVDLYLMPSHRVTEGAALEDVTADGPDGTSAGPAGDLDPTPVGSVPEPGEYALVADLDRDGRFRQEADRRWRDPGTGVAVETDDDGEEPEPPVVPEPPPGPWLTSPEIAGFEAKVRITPAGDEAVAGAAEPSCIVESLCVSGALLGRPEVFVKVIGPRPNGKLWTQISRFTPSEVEVWLRQVATDTTRYYRLGPVGPASDDVSGLQDREAFDPAGAPSSAPRGALLPGAAVEPLPLDSRIAAIGPRLEPGEPEPPAGLDWLTTPELPGFRFKALITPAGGSGVGGRGVDRCIPETLCIQGALAGRPEVFAKIIGPRPNGFLWVQAARFTPSRVELWVEQEGTGTVRYYRLEPVGPGVDDVSGLQDRQAFTPSP